MQDVLAQELSGSQQNMENLYQNLQEAPPDEAPQKTAANNIMFDKFMKERAKPSVIEEQDENASQTTEQRMCFKVKNLNTGEEIEIETIEQERAFCEKVSQRLQKIQKPSVSWQLFWRNLKKNNEYLRVCCESGDYNEVKRLLQFGNDNYPAEINSKGLDDWTPLHYSCYEGHTNIVELLLENKANVNALTKFNRTGLHIATLRGHTDTVQLLCKYKIDCNAGDTEGNTALHFAAEAGYRDIIEYLLEIGCAIQKNKEEKTPIDDCCDEELKKLFLQRGFKESGYKGYEDKSGKNKIERELIQTNKMSTDDFIYYKMLGKGSFGEVFLVKLKGDNSKLYAMKVLSKQKIFGKNLKRYALTQRNVMSVINHPFMAKLFFAFQSPSKLFLVMDYYPGGDLGKLISRKKSLPQLQARKYICELVLAFQALHKNMIVFRDLKPDNVVLDSEGHVRLTDFGLSKEGIYNNTTQSFCGSVAYLAPEILLKQGHSRTVDWYLLGLLLYELIVGLPPYYNAKKEVLFENIKRGPLRIPKNMSQLAKDLIKKLLCRDPRKRLGSQKDSEEIKEHQFFSGVDWREVFQRKLSMSPVEDPKINLNETIKVEFNNTEPAKKIEGWTFIGSIDD